MNATNGIEIWQPKYQQEENFDISGVRFEQGEGFRR